MDILILFLAGLVGGFFAGLLGIGGGIVYIAVLPFALRHYGISDEHLVSAVIANSILATFFAATLSLLRHKKNNNLYLRDSIFIGIPGGLVLITAYKLFVENGSYNFKFFNIFILCILLFLLIRHFLKLKSGNTSEKKGSVLVYSGIGFSGGLLSAFSGLGGGAIVVPLLISIQRINIKKATSISMGFIFFSSLAMSIYNIFFSGISIEGSFGGIIILPIVAPLIVGVIFAAPFGVRAAKVISSGWLTSLFIVFIILVMLTRIIDLLQ